MLETRQAVIANNLANASTPGFRRDVAVGESFSDILTRASSPNVPLGRLSTMTQTTAVYFDRTGGQVTTTDSPYDIAIDGDAFFAVETDNGVRYTRAGNFTLDAESYLITPDGHRVLGHDGAILVDGVLQVQPDGTVYVDGRARGRLMLMAPTAPDSLVKQGHNLFAPAAALVEAAPGTVRVIQGAVELSNVNVVREMVDMIAAYRVFEASQRAILAQDQCLDKAVNEASRVG